MKNIKIISLAVGGPNTIGLQSIRKTADKIQNRFLKPYKLCLTIVKNYVF